MKHAIPFRIIVSKPLANVAMQIQKGRNELLPPNTVAESSLSFEFEIAVDLDDDQPNFLGAFAQGPKRERFVYVNSGTYAGQGETCWSRRAKISLMSISREQINEVLANTGALIETTMPGIGLDGGPTCASVKGIEWRVVAK